MSAPTGTSRRTLTRRLAAAVVGYVAILLVAQLSGVDLEPLLAAALVGIVLTLWLFVADRSDEVAGGDWTASTPSRQAWERGSDGTTAALAVRLQHAATATPQSRDDLGEHLRAEVRAIVAGQQSSGAGQTRRAPSALVQDVLDGRTPAAALTTPATLAAVLTDLEAQ